MIESTFKIYLNEVCDMEDEDAVYEIIDNVVNIINAMTESAGRLQVSHNNMVVSMGTRGNSVALDYSSYSGDNAGFEFASHRDLFIPFNTKEQYLVLRRWTDKVTDMDIVDIKIVDFE